MHGGLAPYLIAVGFPALLLAAFAVFRWRYLRLVERAIHGDAIGPESVDSPPHRRIELPPITLEWIDATTDDGRSDLASLINADRYTRKVRGAYMLCGCVYLVIAAAIVWRGQLAHGVSANAAAMLAYFSTLPSLLIVLAFGRQRWPIWIGVATAWTVTGWLLLVGPIHVKSSAALGIMLNGVDFAALAVICVALLSLRITRSLLLGFVPIITLWVALATGEGMLLESLGVQLKSGFTFSVVSAGSAAAVLGIVVAVRQIRRGVRPGFIALLTALVAVGIAGTVFDRISLVSATIAGVGLNGLLTVLVWWLFSGFLQLKIRGFLPDEVLHVGLCWLVLSVFLATFSLTDRSGVPVLVLPLAASLTTLAWILRKQRRHAVLSPQRMLLLRVFGRGGVQRRLLDLLDDTWRRAGRLDVVVGVDVAMVTLGALALQDFLLGRIDRQFVTRREEVTSRITQLPHRLAIDGRYPLNELHCLPGVWKQVVTALSSSADVVLLDLRGLQPANRGALFELALVIERVRLSQIVLLTDNRTDAALLTRVVQEAWSALPDGSPNVGLSRPRLRLVRCAGVSIRDIAIIRREVFAAAGCGAVGATV
jgi:hypothetical protein